MNTISDTAQEGIAMDYDYDKPGNIPVIAASLRDRILLTSPAPVDPEPEPEPDPAPVPQPGPVDPAPPPPPPPVSATMIRRDIAAPTPLGSVGTIALRDGLATGYDLSGDFPSADGAGEFSFGAIDADNRIRARLFGNGGTDFEVVRIENGTSSAIHQSRVPKLTQDLNLRWRYIPKVESGQSLFYLALFQGSQLIWETKTYQRGLGGSKFAWRTDHPTPATNIQLSPPVDRFRAGTPYLVSASEFRPRIGISYTTLASEPDPAGIEMRQVDLKTGFPVIDWETAILQVGDNGFDLIAVQPSSFTGTAGQLVRTETRNKSVPVFNATSTIFYPKPALFGMNHNQAGTYGGEVIYTDLALTREWRDFGSRSERPDGKEQNFRGSLYIDQDYNIIRTGPDGMTMYFTRPDSEDCYVDISWKGDGQCRNFRHGQGIGSRLNISEYVAGAKGADGIWRGSFRVQHKWADACDITCNVVSTNAADPVRDISFKQRDNPSLGRISDQFVDRIIVNVVRAMDLVNSNGMIDGRWAQRSRTTNAGVGKLNGMAIEDIIYFMNAAHRKRPNVVKGLWVCIPFNSDLDNAIRIVKAYTTGEGTDNGIGLDPGITLYIELGNEIFNGIFPVRGVAIEQAYRSGRATRGVDGENEARIIEQCFNFIRLMKAITENCNMSRVVRVYAHQHSLYDVNLAVVRGILPYVDAGSSAMYFGDSFNNGDSGPYAFTRDFDVLFPRLNKVMDDVFAAARGIRDRWLGFDKPWIPYEGQQHWLMGHPNQANYDQQFYEQFQQHPRMFEAMDRFYTKWEREYGDLIVSYNNIGPISAQYGAWAFTPSQASKLAISPKQAALRKHLGLSYVD